MNQSRTLVLIVAAIAIAAILLLVREHQELQHLRAENAALRQELAEAKALLEELDKLRRQNAALSTRAADPSELARLRADAAALRKLRADLEQPKTPATTATSTNTPPPPPPALTAKGTAQLKVGESFITGGWLMDDGKRGYALVTPVVQTSTDGTQTVMMESRLFAIPTEGLEAAGLAHITAEGRDADKYGVTDGGMTQALFERLKKIPGVDLLSTPSIAVQPGKGATIQLGNQSGGGGLILQLQPNVNDTRDGLNLDYKLDLSPAGGQRP